MTGPGLSHSVAAFLSFHVGYCREVFSGGRFELTASALVELTSPSSSQAESKAESLEGIQTDIWKHYGMGAGSCFLLFWPLVSVVAGEMANSTALVFACDQLSSIPARNLTLAWYILDFNFPWFRVCDPPTHLSSWSTNTFAAFLHTERYLAEFHSWVLDLDTCNIKEIKCSWIFFWTSSA